MRPDITKLLPRFPAIDLAGMDAVALQQRMDAKYIFAERDLPGILAELLPHYRLLQVDGIPGTDYRSLYFDTTDLRSFHEHHNGRVLRCKVRYREYLGSGLCFLEVKRKTGRGDTDKKRLRVAAIPDAVPPDQLEFVRTMSGRNEELVPVLWNHFTRLTLVHLERRTRLTIDLDLRFTSGDEEHTIEGLCVAELKRPRGGHGSPFEACMRARGIRPGGMSKYCVGVLLLGLGTKHNLFKPILRQLDRLRKAA